VKNRALVLVIALILYGCVKVEPDQTTTTPVADSSTESPDAQLQTDAPMADRPALDGDLEAQADTDAGAGTQPEAGDAALPPQQCPDPCPSVGAFRCGDSTHLETCVRQGSCTIWSEPAACPADQICCASHCLAVDIANCYECGTTCDGVTPVCDKTRKSCGCDTASCQALGGKVCDAATHQCVRDPNNPNIYVDPSGGRIEEGTVEHPFRTITAALQVPRASGVVLHVHVAKGRYDQTHGEVFPLVVRGAFIEGSSTAETIIAGTGTYDARVAQGAINAQVSATIVIGDANLSSGISNATIYDTVLPALPAHHGVFCDRGNASALISTPNTTLDHLAIGSGFDIGVVATTSTVPSSIGCNLQVTSSEFRIADVGLWALGCDASAASIGRVPVAVRLGNGTQVGGNRFSGFPFESGIGVRVSGCVSLRSSYGLFRQATGGVDILQPSHMNDGNSHVFQHNIFDQMRGFGIRMAGGAAGIDELSDNTFAAIRPLSQDLPAYAAGLLVEDAKDDTRVARVTNVTNNVFSYNQSGVVFNSQPPLVSGFAASYFNGGNIFHCNAAQDDAAPFGIIGGDVILKTQVLEARPFEFKDNEWDHAPPTSSSLDSATDGTDLIVGAGVYVDTTGATAVNAGCTRP